MEQQTPGQPNIAETLARVLPKAEIVRETIEQVFVAVPKAFDLKEIDLEKLMPNPRRVKLKPEFTDAASFLQYVARHRTDSTVAWCKFDPQTFALSFLAVLDDHAPALAGWRGHTAKFEPDFSAEWKAWKGKDKAAFGQVAFAEWLQDHQDDIASSNSLPTALQMLEMATNFVSHEEHSLKSAVRLQSGGVRLTYIADADQGTVEAMNLFEFFGLGLRVFHAEERGWPLTARLKYRNNSGKLSFSYELQRADKVHELAAVDLIKFIREGLGPVPLLMGSAT